MKPNRPISLNVSSKRLRSLPFALITLYLAASCANPSPEHSRFKLHQQSSQMVSHSDWPGVFFEVNHGCTAAAIHPRVLITAAHCVSGDAIAVNIYGTREDILNLLGPIAARDWKAEVPATEGFAFVPQGYIYRSQKIVKSVDFPKNSPMSAQIDPLFSKTEKGTILRSVGVTEAEFFGKNGLVYGSNDVALAIFPQPAFQSTFKIESQLSPNNFELVSVGHGNFRHPRRVANVSQVQLNNDGMRRQAHVGGKIEISHGTIRSSVAFNTPEWAVLTDGDSGGPLLARPRNSGGEYKIAGIAHSVVFRTDEAIYGVYDDLLSEFPSESLFPANLAVVNTWVMVNSSATASFIARTLTSLPPESPIIPRIQQQQGGGFGNGQQGTEDYQTFQKPATKSIPGQTQYQSPDGPRNSIKKVSP